MLVVPPSRDGDVVSAESVLSEEVVLRFEASMLAKQATGIHGRVQILGNDQVLEYSYINADKGDDRVWLANRAYKVFFGDYDARGQLRIPGMLNGKSADIRTGYGIEALQRDLTQFCSGLWRAWVEGDLPSMVEGFDEPIPPSFVLEPYILDGGGTIIYAMPGRGKSYLLMLMAVSIDAGVTDFWPIANQKKILFINLERSNVSVRNRLTMVNKALGLEPRRPLMILNARGKSLQDVLPAAKAIIERNGIEVVFLDSLSRAGMGDLNDNQAANKAMDSLSWLSPTWLTIGHTPRSNDDHVFGSTMFEAACDIAVQVLSEAKEDGTLGIGLQVNKENDIGKQPLQIWALEFNRTGLAAFRRSARGEFPEVDERRKMTLRQTIMEFILDADMARATPSQIASALGRSRPLISQNLNNERYFVMVERIGRENWYGVAANAPRT